MAIKAIIHVLNDEAVIADLEDLPDPKDNCILARNPRKRDGKRLSMLAEGVDTVIYPWTRITFIELLDEAASATGSGDSIVGFFREDNRSS